MYQQKYLKYKKKYSELKKLQIGGGFYEEEEWFKKHLIFYLKRAIKMAKLF